jgi:hypothetical protein
MSRARSIIASFSTYARMRYVHKMPDEKSGGEITHVQFRSARRDLLPGLRELCRERAVGLNDLFLAALAVRIALRTPDRLVSRHRRWISLGTPLSGRRFAAADRAAQRFFGVALADIPIVLERPDGGFDEVLGDVAEQTRAQRDAWEPAVGLMAARVFAVRRVWPLIGAPHHRTSYRKFFPICGGVSSVVAEHDGMARLGPAVRRYVRACPPGPATPIVLAPSMLDDQLELSLVCREACMTPEQSRTMLAEIVHELERLVSADSEAPAAEAVPVAHEA